MRRPLLFLCVCLFVFTALYMQINSPPPWNSEMAVSSGEEVFVLGQVCKKEYKISFDNEIILIYLNVFDYSKEAKASYHEIYQELQHKNFQQTAKVICEVNLSELPLKVEGDYYVPNLGETVLLQGQWQEFAHATNQGEFDLANYYAIENISGKLESVQLLVSDQEQWYIREWLFNVRQKLLRNLYESFEQEEAAILAKMLLGDGSGLNGETRDLYQNNGIVHILSISGLHISMIGMSIYKLLRRGSCPVGLAAVLGGIFIVLYGAMVGFGVSACRAIGMYLIHMLGELWGKTYDMLTAMGVLAVWLLWDNPKLVYHSGYLLSFASVCGVGLLAPVLPEAPGYLSARPYDAFYKRWLKKRGAQVWSSMVVSLSVTLFTLPIQLFFFYKIPVYSVFLNLLVIPFVSIVMLIGFAVMLLPGLYFLCPVESLIFAWFEWLCKMFEKLPGHTWLTGRPQMWKILFYFGVLIIVICLGKRLRKSFTMIVLMALVLFVGIRGGTNARITFLDVGQGDCICVQTASGECFLFDGGSSSRKNVNEKVIIPYLQFHGISKMDAIFVSHPDEDHMNGVLQMLQLPQHATAQAVTVERIIIPQVANAGEEFEELITAAKDAGVIIEYVAQGAVLEEKEFQLTCLHPTQLYESEDNEYSACYLFETSEFRLLLTADVEAGGEKSLMAELERRGISYVDVLKVAHHGSRYSTSQEFLEVLDAKLAIISCGRKSVYGHPHAETLERLERDGSMVWSTAERGQITIEIGKTGKMKGWSVLVPD